MAGHHAFVAAGHAWATVIPMLRLLCRPHMLLSGFAAHTSSTSSAHARAAVQGLRDVGIGEPTAVELSRTLFRLHCTFERMATVKEFR